MCGITAISRVNGRSSIADPVHFMKCAAIAIEERGRDATGFAWTRADARSFYWKTPGAASEVVMGAPLDDDLTTCVGHARWATQGAVKDNVNNHPVIEDNILLVHNGIIDNEDEVYEHLDGGPGGTYVPKAEVDSQAIAALIAHMDAWDARHPADVLPIILGNAALAWIDSEDPHVLHLARLSGRPLTLGWTRRGDLVMSSTRGTLTKLAMIARVKIRKIREVAEGTYLRVEAGRITEERTFAVRQRPLRVTYGKSPTWTTPYGGKNTTVRTAKEIADAAAEEADRAEERDLDLWWQRQEYLDLSGCLEDAIKLEDYDEELLLRAELLEFEETMDQELWDELVLPQIMDDEEGEPADVLASHPKIREYIDRCGGLTVLANMEGDPF